MTTEFQSWGRYPEARQAVQHLSWIDDPLFPFRGMAPRHGFLAYGRGRSYGDCCLNDDGLLLHTRALDRFMSFDPGSGILKCESGTTLEHILEFAVPRGWFLPVTPGTRHVSVGGAIANDVHGKNHHRSGTFGCHVESLLLLRSDGTRLLCSRQDNPELFAATIGGIGLTGLILWAAIKLRRIENPFICMESIKFRGLEEFFQVSGESDKTFDYTVAWLDCVASGRDFGRGIFMRGNHARSDELPAALKQKAQSRFRQQGEIFSIPFDFPAFALNRFSVSAFNSLYFHRQLAARKVSFVRYEPFFYPLDAVGEWNRIYGRRGLLQFQCLIPSGSSHEAVTEILKTVVQSGKASFLSVIKEFGATSSPGLLSFPRQGVTLCLDLANDPQSRSDLMPRLEAMVVESGGAMYPAKDACMSAAAFRAFYPAQARFRQFIDPLFSSSFGRRVELCEKS